MIMGGTMSKMLGLPIKWTGAAGPHEREWRATYSKHAAAVTTIILKSESCAPNMTMVSRDASIQVRRIQTYAKGVMLDLLSSSGFSPRTLRRPTVSSNSELPPLVIDNFSPLVR